MKPTAPIAPTPPAEATPPAPRLGDTVVYIHGGMAVAAIITALPTKPGSGATLLVLAPFEAPVSVDALYDASGAAGTWRER